jgi:alginate O-acetyltransferase complex protein AlgI
MLFNSFEFGVFFITVYCLYLILNHKWQNRMLLVASYIFYGSWDWRFLSLIWISTVLDYVCGIKIYETNNAKKRRFFLFLSIFGNLLILGFFKYFNFFAANLQELLNFFGFSIHSRFLNILLPVGISFYTFQTMSYTIDIYKKEMMPTRKFFDFALFVAFFPQLVAGPIERAKDLLPQMLSPRKLNLNKFYEGCYLIFWGLFQKMFVADNLSKIVDPVFSAASPYNGAMVLVAVYAFAFQIFCDFAGYSNIARGLGKCMGFEIMVNFNLPYFSTNPRDFWNRWHISLSSWLRDYLYIPLGGNRKGPVTTYRNLAITMLLGGLWHGAAWTFVVWGAYQGMLLMLHRSTEPWLRKISFTKNAFAEKLWFFLRVACFFQIVCIGWIIFRAQSLNQIFYMLKSVFLNFNLTAQVLASFKSLLFYTFVLMCVQWLQFKKRDLFFVRSLTPVIKTAFYALIFYLLFVYSAPSSKEFIYFQF